MTQIDLFKAKLTQAERVFLDQYLPEIEQLFNELKVAQLLNLVHSSQKTERIIKLARSSTAPVVLKNSMTGLFEGDTALKYGLLDALGFKMNTFAEQYGAVLCHAYQVAAERFKLHLVTLIDFSRLGVANADSTPLGPVLGALKSRFPNNKFVAYFDTKIRNSVTHYTYFFEGDVIFFCDGYFDNSPSKMTLGDFLLESKHLNILVEGFFILYLDKYFPNARPISLVQ